MTVQTVLSETFKRGKSAIEPTDRQVIVYANYEYDT